MNWDFGSAAPWASPSRSCAYEIPGCSLQFRIAVLPFHYAMLGFAAMAWLVAWLVEGSRWGFVWRAVKDDPWRRRAAWRCGCSPARWQRPRSAAALTGIGGAIYAQYVGFIDPDSVLSGQLPIGLIPLPAVLGGVGTLWGPLLGAAVLIPLQN